MPDRPRYQLRCAQFCTDRNGEYRMGAVWVVIYGVTQWVCVPCAELLGKSAGIKTTSEVRRETRERERKLQLPMDGAV